MDKEGQWSLAPAFDMTYSYNPSGAWTATHQMTLNGKRDGFTMADFRAAANSANMKRGRAEAMVKEVSSVVRRWPEFAAEAKLDDGLRDKIQRAHSLVFPDA
jgi:serine/threonine-protein kinase HipA